MRTIAIAGMWLLASAALFGQTFEVASVKPNTSGSGGSSTNTSKGQMTMTNVSLKRMIEWAFTVKDFQISAPDWTGDVKFDLAAKIPPGAKETDYALMMRALLVERFKLAVHHESKEHSGYGLVVAKNGFKLKPVEAGSAGTSANGGRTIKIVATKTSMRDLADMVARNIGQPVVDMTGIQGAFDFELSFTREEQAVPTKEGDDATPSLFAALQEQLGLRLQTQKLPIDIIVVDHVERILVEN